MIESLAQFPAEAVPDGRALSGHHFLYPLLAVLVTCWRVGDERPDVEPWVVGGMALAGLFAFVAVWPRHHAVGAALAGGALVLAFVGLLRPAWGRVWPRRERIAVALLLAASLDDYVSHAFGVPTPLDLAFKEWGAEGSAVLMVVLAVAVGLALRLVPEPRPPGHSREEREPVA